MKQVSVNEGIQNIFETLMGVLFTEIIIDKIIYLK